MADATPRPWHVGVQNDVLYLIDGPPSPAPYDGPIPRESGPSVIAKLSGDRPFGEQQANAELIVTAVNSHAALTARCERLEGALRGLLAIIDGSHGVDGWHLNDTIAAWGEFKEVEIAHTALGKDGSDA